MMRRNERGSTTMAIMGVGIVSVLAVGAMWTLKSDSPGAAMNDSAADVAALQMEMDKIQKQIARLNRAVENNTDLALRPSSEPIPVSEMRGGEMLADADVGEDEGEEDRGDRGGRGGRGGRGDFGAGFEDVRKLRELEDPDERIALALQILESGNPMAATDAIETLLELDPAKGVAAVHDLLAGIDPEDRRAGFMASRAVSELGSVEGYSVKSDLMKIFETGSPEVQRAAARALERQGDSTLTLAEISQYSGDLSSSDPGRRLDAVERIGETRSPAAVSSILPLLSDSDSEMRIRALEALGRTGSVKDIESVQAMLNDPVAAVRDRAVRTIESLRTPADERNRGFGGGRGGFGGGRGGRGGR